MPRTVTVKLNGTEWHMPATYKASREIAEAVEDPVKMAIASASSQLEWGTEDIVSIIYIGVKTAGCGMSRDDVGECVVEQGTVEMGQIAGDYIAAIVSGSPSKSTASEKKARPRAGSKR